MSGPHGPESASFERMNIRLAVDAIRAFAVSIDRDGAGVILPHYHGYRRLTDYERRQVLAHFAIAGGTP